MPSPRTKPSRTSLVAFGMLLTVLYVLSYAPVFRFAGDAGDHFLGLREDWQELYRPVEWLTDSTRLREPLMNWGCALGRLRGAGLPRSIGSQNAGRRTISRSGAYSLGPTRY